MCGIARTTKKRLHVTITKRLGSSNIKQNKKGSNLFFLMVLRLSRYDLVSYRENRACRVIFVSRTNVPIYYVGYVTGNVRTFFVLRVSVLESTGVRRFCPTCFSTGDYGSPFRMSDNVRQCQTMSGRSRGSRGLVLHPMSS